MSPLCNVTRHDDCCCQRNADKSTFVTGSARPGSPADQSLLRKSAVLLPRTVQDEGGPMMGNTSGWMGGGMWLWTTIGIVVVVLLAVIVGKMSRK